ncbi:MAG TPA: hypothetical protein VGF84_00160 [Micromonosporaceae bacterium]
MPDGRTDAEIRTSAVFPQIVHAARINVGAVWGVAPLFVAAGAYGIFGHHVWAIVVALLLSVANVGGQLYGFRLSRPSLARISDDKSVRDRAWKLATADATPRAVRWIPGS